MEISTNDWDDWAAGRDEPFEVEIIDPEPEPGNEYPDEDAADREAARYERWLDEIAP